MNNSSKLLIFIFSILLFVPACNKKKIQVKPDNLIQYDVMVNIIADCYLIESMIYFTPDENLKIPNVQAHYKVLFEKYNINTTQLSSSMEYYLGDEESAQKILNDAKNALGERRKEIIPEETQP